VKSVHIACTPRAPAKQGFLKRDECDRAVRGFDLLVRIALRLRRTARLGALPPDPRDIFRKKKS